MWAKKQQLEPYMEHLTGSKSGKEYNKLYIVICLFTLYAEYTSKILSWMNHKLESRLLGKISTTSDMQMDTTLMAESEAKKLSQIYL